MTRLQTRCLVGSAFFHGLIVVVLLATAAFRSAPVITDAQVMNFISPKILDLAVSGGQPVPKVGRPQPSPPAIQPASPELPPHPAPPAPPKPQTQSTPPIPPKPQPQPAPASQPKTTTTTTARQPETTPTPPKTAVKPTPAKRGIIVDFTPPSPSSRTASRNTDSSAAARAATQAANSKRIQQAIADAFGSLDSSVRGTASPVSVVPIPGEGGGEAFISYDTAVKSAYYNAWRPEVTSHRLAVADVRIVVSRNGEITSSELVRKSGDPLLDRSVQRALDAVKQLPPFPPNATDTERSYLIRFDPETKQSAG